LRNDAGFWIGEEIQKGISVLRAKMKIENGVFKPCLSPCPAFVRCPWSEPSGLAPTGVRGVGLPGSALARARGRTIGPEGRVASASGKSSFPGEGLGTQCIRFAINIIL
jgi:hypothetical protein